eukprot:4830457-Pyramimonas_sp.AAC.1
MYTCSKRNIIPFTTTGRSLVNGLALSIGGGWWNGAPSGGSGGCVAGGEDGSSSLEGERSLAFAQETFLNPVAPKSPQLERRRFFPGGLIWRWATV